MGESGVGDDGSLPQGRPAPGLQRPSLTPLPPQLTPLIGREPELAHLVALVRDPAIRLVSVTGPGGVGKTRLAIEAAGALGDNFPDGVGFVSLAPVREPDLVLPAIAQAIGAGETRDVAQVQQALGAYRVLLLLDNFEQVAAAGPIIADVLLACPGVTALVTSRERLRVRGEREYALAPLRLPESMPSASPGAVAALAANPAVALFAERVSEVRSEFAIRPENAATVVEICRRLDGLPLAIELAAARAKVLPLPALLTRMERRLPLLTEGRRDQPARQQTLANTISWSYDLLAPHEQAVLRRLAVFIGGFTLGSAEDVVGGLAGEGESGAGDVFGAVASLVEKSLLRQEPGDGEEARFGFLETVREFGQAKLQERGEREEAHRRHAAWMRRWVASNEAELWTFPVRLPVLDRIEREVGNLRAAFGYLAGAGDAEALLEMGGHLSQFWVMRSYRAEGRAWLERALAMPGTEAAAPDVLARAYFAAASVARTHGDIARAIDLAARSRNLYLSLNDRVPAAIAINLLGALERSQGNLTAAEGLFAEAIALFEAAGDRALLALARCNLAVIKLWSGDRQAARPLFELALGEYRAQNDQFGIAISLHGLAFVAGDGRDLAAAARYLREGIERSREFRAKEILLDALYGSGVVAALAGRWADALTILAAAEAHAAAIGYAVEAPERSRYDRATATARRALDPEVAAGAEEAGRAMLLDAAADAAWGVLGGIAQGRHAAPAKTGNGLWDSLTVREQEVLLLVAEGMSDRQIGDALSISYRTAMRHVTNIHAKLGVRSRAEAARFAREHQKA